MVRGAGIIVAVVILVDNVLRQTGPAHCSYSDGVYECDYDQMTTVTDRPLYLSDFSTKPQQIVLNVNGFLPYFGDARIFDSYFSFSSGMDMKLFDNNYPTRLEVSCGWGGSAYIDTWAFSDMEYVQHFKIKNCDIFYIGLDTVEYFKELDYFGIEGGTIDTIEPLAMGGLTVENLTSATHQFPRQHGKFEVVNANFLYGVVNTGLLTFFTNVTSVTLKNAGISYLSANLFKYKPFVRILELSDNLFTKIPQGCLDYQHGVSELVLYNIDWDCTCDNLWWLQTVVNQNITAEGDIMFSYLQGTSLLKCYYENCAAFDACYGKTESEGSGTISIPDETRSHNRSSIFSSLGGSISLMVFGRF